MPKKGDHSVSIARQYCGALGKVANCQSIVTWHLAQKDGPHFPLVGKFYLPEGWTNDKKRLKQNEIPERRFKFKKKWELAVELLDKVKEETLPYEAIVFDAGYGEIKEFLRVLDDRKEIFLAQIPESHAFWPMDLPLTNRRFKVGRPWCYPAVKNKQLKPLSAKQWRLQLMDEGIRWKNIFLSHLSKKMTQAYAIRVKEVITQAYYRPGRDYGLIIEKLDIDQYKYYISNAPEKTPLKTLIGWAHERWNVEQGYQQLKEEISLDHFEGRSWRGLHHHITLCFMAYAFLLLLRQASLKKTIE